MSLYVGNFYNTGLCLVMLIIPSLFPMLRCPCFYSTNQMDMAIIQPLCYVPQGEKFCPVDI